MWLDSKQVIILGRKKAKQKTLQGNCWLWLQGSTFLEAIVAV
jgi:hypothetical protein